MFQTPRLLPWLNVQQNVEVVLNKNQKKMKFKKVSLYNGTREIFRLLS